MSSRRDFLKRLGLLGGGLVAGPVIVQELVKQGINDKKIDDPVLMVDIASLPKGVKTEELKSEGIFDQGKKV